MFNVTLSYDGLKLERCGRYQSILIRFSAFLEIIMLITSAFTENNIFSIVNQCRLSGVF